LFETEFAISNIDYFLKGIFKKEKTGLTQVQGLHSKVLFCIKFQKVEMRFVERAKKL
jgi:hypothetical protein